ncbi:phosphopantetheine adenylyltransferase [Limnobacter parvus]|uniref:Phosphopantetheine adenylyltransferase n=1 Tax=Limnobacter parvus TaxID=2939690 RepID=A0ABT1XF19_9BURK|nr:phosphopantetheine adenylyltransferase [Limnobacter parvus]MCR2745479.1 phosphopantetheine adenylyltransferase [Limnobacter parvus]
MNWISNLALAIAAIIHFLPVSGILGKSALQKLYGVGIDDPNLLIAMQHRALLFGLLGVLFVVAIFKADLRLLAMGFGLVSTAGFIAIAWQVGDYNPLIARVVKADVIVIGALLIGLGNEIWLTRS